MLDLDQVRKDILHWSETFVEVPHIALGGWPPCPYARQARLKKNVGIFVGNDPYSDLKDISKCGMNHYEVIIYAYDPVEYPYEVFHTSLESANKEFLLANDLIVLEDHPMDAEIVNGISMNQGKYALALVQALGDLNIKAKLMEQRGFYHAWPKEYLQLLFTHRKDPRV